ncbi:GNAT family protein [Streptomyces sp. NPDC006296]|uniref:GNAT family N-acetyltransferase n=1 Tax=Streptomyces sp. NPDC006296 TaxID=3156746 RepID=UPI0033B5DEB8
MNMSFERVSASDSLPLISFLTSDNWPFHALPEVDRETAGQWVAEGRFASEESRSFWVRADGATAGLVRLMDLGDRTPLFDLRLRAADRGRGIGTATVTWLTRYLFEEFPGVHRIEGTTRQDNRPMRRVFVRCGYVKEAHYRDAWPSADGGIHDAVGYAVLRRDWLSGTVTTPQWDDEPAE